MPAIAAIMMSRSMMRLIVQQMHLQMQLLFLVGGLEYITGVVRLNGWFTVGC